MSGKTEQMSRHIYVLAAGTFLMGTTEFMIAGLLPDIVDACTSARRAPGC